MQDSSLYLLSYKSYRCTFQRRENFWALKGWRACMWCLRMGRRMGPRALCCGIRPLPPQTARGLAARASTCPTQRAAREAAPKGQAPLATADSVQMLDGSCLTARDGSAPVWPQG